MKKSLSLLALAAFALAANAQQEVVWTTQEGLEALGLSSDATELAEMTLLAENENIGFYNAYTDNAKIMDISADGVKSVVIDGEEYKLTKGTTGSSNPGGVSINTPPTSGWVYCITVKEDGYLTLFSKLSSNKSYYVFEGDASTGLLQTYTLRMLVDLGEGKKLYEYTLPGDEEYGYFSMDLPDADKYSNGTDLRWPEKIFLGADAADVKKNGFGCITFPVYADAGTYLFNAQGSKANTNGVIFTKEEPKEIGGFNGDGECVVAFLGNPTSAIASVAVDANANTQMYNVLGQPVDNGYKGLVIKNGKKFINR